MKLKIKTDELNFELEKDYEHSMSEIKEIIARIAEESINIQKQKQIENENQLK
jgi:hypothetical protein